MKAAKNVSSFHSLEAFLVAKHEITPEQAVVTRRLMSDSNVNFGTAVIFLGFLSSPRMVELLAAEFGIPHVEPKKIVLSPVARKTLPPELARELQVFPLSLIDDSGQTVLLLGMTDPIDRVVAARVERQTRMKVQRAFLSPEDLQALLRQYFRIGLGLYGSTSPTTSSVRVAGRIESVTRGDVSPDARRDEMKALITLLIRKGVFTLEELQQEMGKA